MATTITTNRLGNTEELAYARRNGNQYVICYKSTISGCYEPMANESYKTLEQAEEMFKARRRDTKRCKIFFIKDL